MGKKNKGRNRGSLGEDFEDSYEYDADDGGYQDYGKKKNKRRNRDSNNGYDDFGYDDYGSEEDNGQDYDVYGREEDEYDTDDSDASSDSSSSAYERSDYSTSSYQNSTTVSSSVFKESKPSPLGGMHPVKATPNANGFTPRSATPYEPDGRRDDSGGSREGLFGFKKVSVTPDLRPVKPHDENASRLQTSERSNSVAGQERGDEDDSTTKKKGFSGLFGRRHDNEENESRQEEKEALRERKAREKTEKSINKSDDSDAETEDALDRGQLRKNRIDEIQEDLANIDNDIREFRQFNGSDDEINEANSAIEALNQKRKALIAELWKLGAYRMAFHSSFSSNAMTGPVKAVGKMISSPFSAFRRRKSEDGGEDETLGDEDSSREERESLRRKRREERLRQSEEKKEEKKRIREEKKESRRSVHNQVSDSNRPVDDSVDESDDDAPSPDGRRWVVLAHRTLGVTIVATVLLVGGYVGYMFLGHGNDKQQTVAERKSVAGSERAGRPSVLSGKYASKTTTEESNALVSNDRSHSGVSGTEAEKSGWWSRLKSKFSRKNNSSVAKKSEKKKDKSDKKESKVANLGKSASETLKKTTDGVKSKFDSFNEELMSENDALKEDLDEIGAIMSKKTDELGDALSDLTASVSSQSSDAIDSVSDAASDLVDSGKNAFDDLKDSFGDVGENLSESISEATDSLEDAVELNDPIVVNEDSFAETSQSDDGTGTIAAHSFDTPDELVAANAEDDDLDVAPENAKFIFGDTPVRTASTPSTSASDEGSTEIEAFPSEDLATAVSDEPENSVGAVWGVPDDSGATSQTTSSAYTNDSPSLSQESGNLVAPNAVASETRSIDAATPSLQDAENFDGVPSLLSLDETDAPPASPALSESSPSDEGMSLFVADASGATLELDEASDMNGLSGAAPILQDDLETWNSTPSLTSQGNLSSENSLTTTLNNFNSRVESLADSISEASNNVREGLQSNLNELGSALNDGVASLQNRGQQTLNSLNESFSGAKGAYDESVGNVGQSLETLTNTLGNARQSASDTLQDLGSSISDNFNTLQNQFANSNANVLTSTNPLSSVSTSPSSLGAQETLSAAPSLSQNVSSVEPKTSSLDSNALLQQNVMSTTPAQSNIPSTTGAQSLQTTPAQNAALVALPELSASQPGIIPNVGTVAAVPASTSTVGTVASDASDLVPENIDYAYSMSPLGRAGSGMRIDSSTIATPTTQGTSAVPLATTGTQATSAVGSVGSTVGSTVVTPNGYRQYVTKEGDNLLTIADRELGSSSRWGEIKRLNNLRSGATYFEAGTKLLLPATTPSGQ